VAHLLSWGLGRRHPIDWVVGDKSDFDGTSTVIFFGNNAAGPTSLIEDRDRVLLGFPGASGTLRGSTVRCFLIRQQPTSFGELDGAQSARLASIAQRFQAAGFPAAISTNMDGSLKTHAVFVTAISAGLYLADGDPRRLAEMPDILQVVVLATKDGFRPLRALGRFDAPRNLQVLYGWMPTWFAVRYWRRALLTPLGELGFAAHANAAREEMTLLAEDVLGLMATSALPAPRLEDLYVRAGMAR